MKKNKIKISNIRSGGGYLYNKTNIKYIISLSIVLIGILSLLSGTSYAILKGNTSDTNEQVIKTGKIELTLTESYDNINKKITVMSDEDGLLQEETYDFNIKNTGDASAKYDLKLINEVPSTYTGKVLDTKYIKIGLEINGTEYGPMSLEKVKNIIDSDIIYKKEMINFKMRIWLDKTKEKDIENLEDYKAFLKLKIEAVQRPESMDSGVNTKTFNYTGKPEEYTVPRDGYYYIEMAGGAGHAPSSNPNFSGAAKTSGYIYLESGEKLYFYVGGKAVSQKTETFNGGGGAGYGDAGYTIPSTISGDTGKYGYTGGAATDVRLVGGEWNDMSSLISRIMVAGGGGSASSAAIYNNTGGNSECEGLRGINGAYYSGHGDKNAYGKGATQISGGAGGTNLNSYGTNYAGSFGRGGTSNSYSSASDANAGSSGGGGGYYGGGAGAGTGGGGTGHGSGGGSSYISGYAGVNSVKESTTITHTNQTLHYSGKYFIGGKMLGGSNYDDGYAKITYVDIKPKRRNSELNNVRYIKDCSSYNSANNNNHWIELQAIKDGSNIAKGKTVTGTTAAYSDYPYSRVTDGDITYSNYAEPSSYTTNQCITVDLESTYDLDEIAVWNYFGDQRSYYDNVTYVSSDNKTFTKVINEANIQNSNGRRINAYNDTYNGYAQDNLVLWYDGYANTGTTRNNTTTTWKDLSGNNHVGNLTGGTWYSNYLYFDGVDDTVLSNILASTLLPSDQNRTLSITMKVNNLPYTNATNGNTGVFFGAVHYSGMGIFWLKSDSSKSYSVNGGIRTGDNASQITSISKIDYFPTKIINITYVNNIADGKTYLYYDGVLVDTSKTVTGSYIYASNMGNVGINKAQIFSSSSTTSYANMNVYSARIYNQALTSNEIVHNYNYDKQRFNID